MAVLALRGRNRCAKWPVSTEPSPTSASRLFDQFHTGLLALFRCVLGLLVCASSNAQQTSNTPDLLAIVANGAQYPLGESFSLRGPAEPSKNCFSPGAKTQLSQSTGVRLESIDNLSGNTDSIRLVYEVLGIAPPRRLNEVGEPPFEFEKWLAAGKLVFAVVLSRDDGVFGFGDIRLNEAVIESERPGLNVLSWLRKTCGGVLVDRWRLQARRMWVFHLNANIPAQSALAKRLLNGLSTGAEVSATSAIFMQRTRKGDTEILEHQRRMNLYGVRWPSEAAWAAVLEYGDVDVETLSLTARGYVSRVRKLNNARDLARTFDGAEEWIVNASAAPTHLGIASVDDYVPSYLRRGTSETLPAEKYVNFALEVQRQELIAYQNRRLALEQVNQIKTLLADKYSYSALITEDVRADLVGALKKIGERDEISLLYWKGTRERQLNEAEGERPYSIGTTGPWYGGRQNTAPAILHPSAVAARSLLLWFGSCGSSSGRTSGVPGVEGVRPLPPNASTFFFRMNAAEQAAFISESYKTGFLVPMTGDNIQFLTKDYRPIPNRWDGLQYRLPFVRRADLATKSDILFLLSYDYPIQAPLTISFLADGRTESPSASMQVIPVIFPASSRRQALFGIVPCVDIKALASNKPRLKISNPRDNRTPPAYIKIVWEIAPDGVSRNGLDPLPKWYLDELEKASIRSRIQSPR